MGRSLDAAPRLVPAWDPAAAGGVRSGPGCVRLALQAARNALAQEATATPNLAFMARAAGVSPRTLQRHFARILSMAPRAVVRRLRLDAARQTLRSGECASVLDAATRHGFEHPGRFAIHYARIFGEPPSTTLRAARARPSRAVAETPIVLRALSPATPAEARRARRVTDDLAIALGNTHGVTLHRDGAPHAPPRALLVDGRVEDGDVMLCLLRPSSGAVLATLREPLAPRGGVGWADRATAALRMALRREEEARAQRTPRHRADVEALVARARPAALSQEPEATSTALDMLGEALHRDPAHSCATALAAFGHAVNWYYGFAADADAERCRGLELSRRAVAVAAEDPEVLTLVAGVLSLTKQQDQAEVLVRKSLALDPHQPEALRRLGFIQNFRGHGAAAAAAFRCALALYPGGVNAAIGFSGLGAALFVQGHYASAARALKQALERQPSRLWPHRFIAAAAMHVGATAEAQRSLLALRRAFPDLTLGHLSRSDALHPEALDRVLDGLYRAGLPP